MNPQSPSQPRGPVTSPQSQPAGVGHRDSHGPTPGIPPLPPGWPGRPPRRPGAPRQRLVLDPGRPTWMDAVVVLAYLGIFILGGAFLVMLIPGFVDAFRGGDGTVNEEQLTFTVNLVAYAVLTVLALIACWRPFIASFRTFRHRGWLKAALLPVIWLVCIGVNGVVVMSNGGDIKSDNQLAIEGMTLEVPFLPVLLVTGFMAPFVEEYIFRHLLVGRLSRWVNVWVCGAVSVVLFALIHFVATGFRFDPVQLIPYLTLSVAITLAYILTGRSLAYAVILHVLNNVISIVVAYTLLPLVSEGL